MTKPLHCAQRNSSRLRSLQRLLVQPSRLMSATFRVLSLLMPLRLLHSFPMRPRSCLLLQQPPHRRTYRMTSSWACATPGSTSMFRTSAPREPRPRRCCGSWTRVPERASPTLSPRPQNWGTYRTTSWCRIHAALLRSPKGGECLSAMGTMRSGQLGLHPQ